jgi:hypothetical protein
MKLKITILFLSIYAFTFSQSDNVSYKDLGIQKKPVKIESMTYSMEDKFVTDNASDLYTFDENGSILLHEFNIYGDYASSTSEISKYQNDKIIQREVTVKNRPNFSSVMTFKYENDNLKQKTYQAKYYKNEFLFSYDKDNKLIEIKGVYNSNYSIEKYYYNQEKLYKTVIQYFNNDTISSQNMKLYIDDKVVVEYDGNDKFSKAYLKEEKSEMLLQLNHAKPLQEINKIESKIINENMSFAKFKEYLLNKSNAAYVKVIVNERCKNNENNDWIAKMGIDKMFKEERKYYTFRKITYADGTESGSTDFNIFTINELKAMFK